jgi:hypothetical protein
MGVIALIVWLVTAAAGLYLLAIWLIEYDRDFQSAAATRLPVPVISGHALLAISGLGVWGAYLIFDNNRLAWAAVIILGAVAVLGLTMAVRWLGVYRTAVATTAGGGVGGGVLAPAPTVPPERNFPVVVVISHGIFAVATLLLVLLTALGAWGS